MHTAITTKFLASTNHRGPRIQARAQDPFAGPQKVTLPYQHEHSLEFNHLRAAQQLHLEMQAAFMLPAGTLTGGCLGDDYVWVLTAP